MIRINEGTIVNDKYSTSALINYDEKDCIHNKLGSSFLKNYTLYYLKNNVLNKDSFDLALQNYKHFFENNKTLCILSILNVLIILFPLFLYLIFSIVIILPVFFLLCSLFFCMLPLIYPLIKDKIHIKIRDEIIFCTSITAGSFFFFISILFIYLIPFINFFLYPFNAIFMPVVSTLILPLILFINILACVIYLFQYTEVFLSMKCTTKNIFRNVLLKMSY
ncbi:conserved Plasmodium membrane protein, unknown function [Plasmodium sp. gorilla clade G3]|nr:conserved Plasmodium membrane protein, unknown function [Plasmodium sp. gorilla clade G3]